MMMTLRNFNYHFNTSVSTKSQCRYYKLSFITKPLFSIRFYLSSRCMQAMRTAYNVANTISTYSEIEKNNAKPFISQIVRNSINAQSIPQHEATLWKHLSHQRLPAEDFYDYFKDISANGNLIKYEPHTLIDFRTTNEFAVLQEYIKTYGHDIAWVYATLDARSANFPKAQQSNPDFWVYIDKAFGLKRGGRCTYQDEKSGMDMVRHSSRGSVGILCYDENGVNIQITSQPITVQDLIIHYEKNIRSFEAALKEDGLLSRIEDIRFSANPFAKTLYNARSIVNDMEHKSFKEFKELHTELQNLLWEQLQCNPNYNRSVSFVFLKEIVNSPMTDRECVFSQEFQSRLKPNYLYNLDKKGDLKELYNAFMHAGKKIDPIFIDKLYHLHNNGITLTNDILLILKEITKNAIH